jgi:hypothetical protein
MAKKKLIIIGIQIGLAFLHVIGIGRNSTNTLFILSASYFSDLVLPFGFYFLLILLGDSLHIFQRWWIRALVIFLAATTAEIAQYFGIYALGRTFDPIDILVYALGVLLAILIDLTFSRLFNFWKFPT